MAEAPTAELAHTPACGPNVSDLGLMLAWTCLVDVWAEEPETTLVVCNDPWMFRHLAGRSGETSGPAPALWLPGLKLAVRGFASRCKCALTVGVYALKARRQRKGQGTGEAVLLVYGHPKSGGQGYDAYFGDLMNRIPKLKRMMHVDCDLPRARELAADGRTFSLHGWGQPVQVLALPFLRWRPLKSHFSGPYGWLVRRAAAREGGTGQAAMIGWQLHCQGRWLASRRPHAVAWPWENHSWERVFVRAARELGVTTIGYQHSVVGPQMLNYSPASNPDGAGSLPDHVICSGPPTMQQLAAWKVPKDRLAMGGALRFDETPALEWKPSGPVFMALPFGGAVAGEMVEAARAAAAGGGVEFLIKDHPMTPFPFEDSKGVTRTDIPLGGHDGLSAVVFAATTVGLEALMAGIPAIRFLPREAIAIDILPPGLEVPTTDWQGLKAALENITEPAPISRHSIFAEVDFKKWSRLFGNGDSNHEE